ncbi:MAG: AAA family ATPase [Deltaproteobacteria bacterium RIFCSPHIGHO2_12_FULL_43_9]|nr:MAG: AAA family ATPase [Deltaproteobacteria bacterium RIFCSPHIGHO2_12_FULL_43_9]
MYKRVLESTLKADFRKYPIVTVVGPRQSGKTTLVREAFGNFKYTNLEDPAEREFAKSDPRGFLKKYDQSVIIDEIQRVPELTSYIQVLVDERKSNGQFVLTGSQNFSIREALSQTLSGRTSILTLLPFSMDELKLSQDKTDWIYKGFYPRIYDSKLNPTRALSDYVSTYVERDLRQITAVKDLAVFQTFIKTCATNIGQIINLENIGNECGISQTTAREWLSILEASFIIFRLQPYHVNIRKRLIKRPKLYFYDVGLASYLLGIESKEHVDSHPLRGSLFENMVIVEIMKYRLNRHQPLNFNFYRDSDDNEIDLFVNISQYTVPIEIKYSSTISEEFTRAFRIADKLFKEQPYGKILVYGGDKRESRSPNIEIVPFNEISPLLEKKFSK